MRRQKNPRNVVIISYDKATQTDNEPFEAATQREIMNDVRQPPKRDNERCEAATQRDNERCEAATQRHNEPFEAATQTDSSLQQSCRSKGDPGGTISEAMNEELRADLPNLGAVIKNLLKKINYLESFPPLTSEIYQKFPIHLVTWKRVL
jgi:hypothetical protein